MTPQINDTRETSLADSRILAAERHAWNYWFVDGLFNIFAGIGCLLLTIFFGFGDRRNTAVGLCCYFLFLAMIYRRERILEWLKQRITYPRTGYVPYPYKPPPEITELHIDDPEPDVPSDIRRVRRIRTLRSLVGAVVLGAAFVLLVAVRISWICLPAAALCGFAFWWASGTRINRLPITLVGMILLGLAMSLWPVGGFRRIYVLLAGSGAIFVVDGTVTLFRYLRRNPVAGA